MSKEELVLMDVNPTDKRNEGGFFFFLSFYSDLSRSSPTASKTKILRLVSLTFPKITFLFLNLIKCCSISRYTGDWQRRRRTQGPVGGVAFGKGAWPPVAASLTSCLSSA